MRWVLIPSHRIREHETEWLITDIVASCRYHEDNRVHFTDVQLKFYVSGYMPSVHENVRLDSWDNYHKSAM